MIVLTLEPGEAEKLAEGAPTLQRRFGMPIDPAPYPRPASSEPACRAVVAARVNAPGTEEALLRRLRVRTMLGGLLDDPEPHRRRGQRGGPRPGPAGGVVRDRGGHARARRRHHGRPPPRARRRRARPQARRPARGAPLHGAELRDRPPARTASPRSCRASTRSRPTRWRSRTSRPTSSAGAKPGVGRGGSRVGRRAAGDGRGRGGDADRRDRGARRPRARRRPARGRAPTSTGRSTGSEPPRERGRATMDGVMQVTGAAVFVPALAAIALAASAGAGTGAGPARPTRPATAGRPRATARRSCRSRRPLQGPRRRLPRPRARARHGHADRAGDAIVRRVRATGRGTFVLAFSGVQACGGVEGVAAGSRGSHASFQFSSLHLLRPAGLTAPASRPRRPAARRPGRSASLPGRRCCSPSR